MKLGTFFLPALALLVVSPIALAQAPAFGENYISAEIVKNQPLSSSQERFSSGGATAFAGFRHILADQWLMGVHVGFKRLQDKESKSEVNIFTALQESKFLIRLYDPVYMAIGPRFFYLLPTEGRKIPPEREKNFRREVGSAISVDLIYNLNRNILLTFRIDRWGGMSSGTFSGTETGLGINYRLP